ncbi:hypothetical protein COY95_02310, partial [Candidatus Woesearchaeota archaeon CG_4_10_14_0_8_um_filter_47_5]
MNTQIIGGFFTILFFLVVLSYYILILIPRRKTDTGIIPGSLSIIIPAHNEGPFLQECITSVLGADFTGTKEVLVVDDGSSDNTYTIAHSFKKQGVRTIRTRHSGKSASMNLALAHARGELIAIIDGDSIIHQDALSEMAKAFRNPVVVGACGVVKVKNRKTPLGVWLHLELLYNSLIRSLSAKVNANITTPGPLSMYRKKELDALGGFSTEGFSEDQDIAIRLIRAGHHIDFVDTAVAETNMPLTPKEFLRQRTRYARGAVNILRRHLKLSKNLIDIYTMPLFFFSYLQSIIMSSITLCQVTSGYYIYFFAKGMYLNRYVIKFFFDWFSILGFVQWVVGIFRGTVPL